MDDELELKHKIILECLTLIKIKQGTNHNISSLLSKLFDQAYQMGVEDGYKVAMELDDLLTEYYK